MNTIYLIIILFYFLDWKKVLSLQPDHKLAKMKIQYLQPMADKQFEEKKDEVVGKQGDFFFFKQSERIGSANSKEKN